MAAELKIEHEIVDVMVLDRVHRIGRYAKGLNVVRPIVAKFHKYADRERGKELGPVFGKAKKDGKDPRFIMDRLFIDGVEYT